MGVTGYSPSPDSIIDRDKGYSPSPVTIIDSQGYSHSHVIYRDEDLYSFSISVLSSHSLEPEIQFLISALFADLSLSPVSQVYINS
jgi:hypothetical protein